MTLLRTIGSPIVDVDRCVYLNTHAKHPINEKLEAKIRDKRIEMGLDPAPQSWPTYVTQFHDNRIYYAADDVVWWKDPPAEIETRPIG